MPACPANIFSRSESEDVFQPTNAIFMDIKMACVYMYLYTHIIFL